MPESIYSKPTFNLWTEGWISLERPDGSISTLGLEQTLLQAQNYISIYETSPLVIVGIHRLLVAILQFAFNPRNDTDLLKIWREGRFAADVIEGFGKIYAHRFDLFSNEPFLQSAANLHVPG